MFRTLKEHEIECRVKKCTEKGAVILLYKTARTDMDILDETIGATNWESDYKEIKGNLYCGIGLLVDENRMVWKWDCGIEPREDGEGNNKKGEASDAFKRAGFKWGIGRELYTAPFIFVPKDKVSITEKNGRFSTYDTFSVERIAYDENRKICGICIPYSDHVEIGVMIETPAAAMISDRLAKEVDFFSCGTNDLTQYTLACDRQNNDLGRFYDPHHLSVVRLLKMVVENAHKNGVWVGICGELGADLEMTETFLAIGVDELSVTPRAVLAVRNKVRSLDMTEATARILAEIDGDASPKF